MLSMAFHHEHIILINLNTYLRHGALKWSVELVWRTSITTFLCFTCDVWRDAMEVWGTICKRQQCKLSCNWENQHETNEDESKYLIPSERGHVFKNIVKLKWMLFVFWCKFLAFIFSHHTFIGMQDIKNKINGGFSYYYFLTSKSCFPLFRILFRLAWGEVDVTLIPGTGGEGADIKWTKRSSYLKRLKKRL